VPGYAPGPTILDGARPRRPAGPRVPAGSRVDEDRHEPLSTQSAPWSSKWNSVRGGHRRLREVGSNAPPGRDARSRRRNDPGGRTGRSGSRRRAHTAAGGPVLRLATHIGSTTDDSGAAEDRRSDRAEYSSIVTDRRTGRRRGGEVLSRCPLPRDDVPDRGQHGRRRSGWKRLIGRARWVAGRTTFCVSITSMSPPLRISIRATFQTATPCGAPRARNRVRVSAPRSRPRASRARPAASPERVDARHVHRRAWPRRVRRTRWNRRGVGGAELSARRPGTRPRRWGRPKPRRRVRRAPARQWVQHPGAPAGDSVHRGGSLFDRVVRERRARDRHRAPQDEQRDAVEVGARTP